MSLKNFLRKQGYDLIEGPVRNHKPLQIWLKVIFEEIELYYEHISHAFKSNIELKEVNNVALNVTSEQKDEFSFNIGLTILEDILQSLGMGNVGLSAVINSGKTIKISYSDSITKEFPVGQIEEYLSKADFVHTNSALLRNANKNNLILITGIVYAKNLEVDIVTDFDLSADLILNLNNLSNAKIEFTKSSDSLLKLSAKPDHYFPIAVKANRLDFDRGIFDGMKIISDNRNFY